MEKSIEELIYEETEQRLKEMSTPSYKFPEKANRADYIGIAAAVVGCLAFIVLCMTGVIA